MPVLLDKPMPSAGMDKQVGGKEGSREEARGCQWILWVAGRHWTQSSPHPQHQGVLEPGV